MPDRLAAFGALQSRAQRGALIRSRVTRAPQAPAHTCAPSLLTTSSDTRCRTVYAPAALLGCARAAAEAAAAAASPQDVSLQRTPTSSALGLRGTAIVAALCRHGTVLLRVWRRKLQNAIFFAAFHSVRLAQLTSFAKSRNSVRLAQLVAILSAQQWA